MARYIVQGIARDVVGNIIETALVKAYVAGTSTVATFYPDTVSGASTGVYTDSYGRWKIYFDTADYTYNDSFDIAISKSGYDTQTIYSINPIASASVVAEIAGYVSDAEDARDAALAAQAAAELAETNAETAESNAELAETNAETAQGLAEDARDAAVIAQNAAEDAADAAAAAVALELQGYVDDAQGYASDASGYATAAQGYMDDAQGYANDASGYASGALNYADLAAKWAEEDEDVLVGGVGYSSYHWAQKAEDFAESANAGTYNETTAPSTAANQLKVYAKDVSGVAELFIRKESDGTEVQVTDGDSLTGGSSGSVEGFYTATALTGGGTGALDAIDGAALEDGDIALVTSGLLNFVYILDVDLAGAEASPHVIAPDANGGDKRWVLTGPSMFLPQIGSAPSATRADRVQMWAADYAAGDARLYLMGESSTDTLIFTGNTIAMSDPSINHGMTTYLATTEYLRITKNADNNGGVIMTVANDDTSARPFVLYSLQYDDPSSSDPLDSCIRFVGGRKSGAGITTIPNSRYLHSFYNGTTHIGGFRPEGAYVATDKIMFLVDTGLSVYGNNEIAAITNAYGGLQETDATNGGLKVTGIATDDAVLPLTLIGGTGKLTPAPSVAMVNVVAKKYSSGADMGAIAATEKSFEIFNSTTSLASMDGDGDLTVLKSLLTPTTAMAAVKAIGNSGDSKTINWAEGIIQTITLTPTSACTLTFTNPAVTRYTLIITQGAGGSKTITWPTIKWAGGVAPTLSTAAAAIDIVSLVYDGTNYYGMFALGFA